MSATDIIATLERINSLLSEIEVKLGSLEKQTVPQVDRIETSFRNMERIMLRTVVMLRRFSGDENVDRVLEKIARLLIMLRMVQMALHMATAAAGPWGILMAVAMAGTVTVVGADTFSSMVDTT